MQLNLYGNNVDVLKKIKKYIEKTYGKAWLGKKPQGKTTKEYIDNFYNNPSMITNFAYNIKIDELMFLIIYYFVKDKYKKIVDPTCGIKNRQFSNILDILQHWNIEYYACDKDQNNWGGKVCDVFNIDTLPSGDVFIYDPPFLPRTRSDERAKDYGIENAIPIEDIKKFYSKEVFNNFRKKGAKLLIVKGEDFYFPTKSNNLYLFDYIIQRPEGYKLIAKITYKFFNPNTAINGFRLAKSIKKEFSRALNTSTSYFIYEFIKP